MRYSAVKVQGAGMCWQVPNKLQALEYFSIKKERKNKMCKSMYKDNLGLYQRYQEDTKRSLIFLLSVEVANRYGAQMKNVPQMPL